MITMHELVDLRMQQHIVHEIYRQQIMQRIPDPFPTMAAMQPQLMLPNHPPLPDVETNLENDDLWQQFHKIGTEMIITKTGRRMFPSMRLSLSGLEDETNYCVLLEMVPIGDCRYKFSGSQWMPAGGAEPQSPQRMYLHPDSPASGAHWQAQPILFNKVKLTNNTLDSNGHIVLASMHKYQPRIHVIRSSDLTQIPWAPQQTFLFPETEFIAVTAYQNDRITKLKIDNNPFAKGFREAGQSRCKRKMSSSPTSLIDDNNQIQQQQQQQRSRQRENMDDDHVSVSSQESQPLIKRMRSNSSAISENSLLGESCTELPQRHNLMITAQCPAFINFSAYAYYAHPTTMAQQHPNTLHQHRHHMPNIGTQISSHLLQSQINYLRQDIFANDATMYQRQRFPDEVDSRSSSTHTKMYDEESEEDIDAAVCDGGGDDEFVDVVSTTTDHDPIVQQRSQSVNSLAISLPQPLVTKTKSFSISSILGAHEKALSNFS